MAAVEFNQVLTNNAQFLMPFAVALTRDTEAAKDLFQETIYRALVNKDKYKVGTNVKAWLFTIMRNVFINGYRRKAKRQTIFDFAAGDVLINTNQANVYNNAIGMLNLKELQKAVYSLPDIFKTPFLLHFDGFKYHEIAEVLNEPLGTIKSRIHFARKLLKEQTERY